MIVYSLQLFLRLLQLSIICFLVQIFIIVPCYFSVLYSMFSSIDVAASFSSSILLYFLVFQPTVESSKLKILKTSPLIKGLYLLLSCLSSFKQVIGTFSWFFWCISVVCCSVIQIVNEIGFFQSRIWHFEDEFNNYKVRGFFLVEHLY